MIKKIPLIIFLTIVVNFAFGQRVIKGKVTDERSEPLPGVTIQIVGKGIRTTTDPNGSYVISVNDESKYSLIYSFIGYQKKTLQVGKGNVINVQMFPDNKLLDEVVVTGYGTLKKGNMISAYGTVTAQDINRTSNTTIDQALQGRIAGVSISQNSGQPGGGMNVIIRGLGSVNGNCQPLYVIDGVEISGNGSTNGSNPLAGINPSDIESLDVLQGPSATALYGSRGSDGVILVSTKRGKAGKTKINYEFSYNYQTTPKFQETISLTEFATLSNTLNEILGYKKNPMFSDPSVLGQGTNWQKELFDNAASRKHQITVMGGTEENKYYFSGEKFDQDGVVKGSFFNRLSFRLNLDNALSKNLKLSTNLNFSQTKEDVNISENDVIVKAIMTAPDIAAKNLDGTWGGPGYDNPNGMFYPANPLALANLIDNNIKRTEFNGSFNLSYTVPQIKGLTLSSRLTNRYGIVENYYFKPTYEMGPISNLVAVSRRGSNLNWNWQWNQMLEYKKNVNNTHDLNLMFTHEASGGGYNSLNAGSQGHINNLLSEVQLGLKDTYSLGSGKSESPTMESYLGRINYGYKNRYIVNIAYRVDGTALFAKNKRWAPFPSASIAWRASSEPFLLDLANKAKINELKFRFETGLTGKSLWGYNYLAKLSTQITEWGVGYAPNNFENDNFQWESTKTYNFGLDFAMFKNRLQITADLYQRYTSNMIGVMSVPWYMGMTTIQAPTVNSGSIENKGWGVTLKGVVIDSKKFKWVSSFNISRNENKLNTLTTSAQTFMQRQLDGNASNFTARSEIGNPLWMFYGFKSDGVYTSLAEINRDYERMSDPTKTSLNQEAGKTNYNTALPKNSVVGKNQSYVGDLKYRDMNNDGKIDEKDMTVIGNPWPKFQGGFTNEFSYKDFTLSILMTYSAGNDIFNLTAYRLSKPGDGNIGKGMLKEGGDYAKLTYVYDEFNAVSEVNVTNPYTRIPRIATTSSHGNYNRLTDLWVEDGSYIRLKNIALSYNVPSKYLSKTKLLSTLKASISAQNLFTFTKYKGYDPEIGAYTQRNADAGASPIGVDYGRYPSTPSFIANILIGF